MCFGVKKASISWQKSCLHNYNGWDNLNLDCGLGRKGEKGGGYRKLILILTWEENPNFCANSRWWNVIWLALWDSTHTFKLESIGTWCFGVDSNRKWWINREWIETGNDKLSACFVGKGPVTIIVVEKLVTEDRRMWHLPDSGPQISS
jgi:hypothetical protein